MCLAVCMYVGAQRWYLESSRIALTHSSSVEASYFCLAQSRLILLIWFASLLWDPISAF